MGRKPLAIEKENLAQLPLPGILPLVGGTLRVDRGRMRHLVALALRVEVANDEDPRGRIAKATLGTPQAASAYLNASYGINAITLINLMIGFPLLQKAVMDVVRGFNADPTVLDRKIAELESTWRSLRTGD